MTDFQSHCYMATHTDIDREEDQARNGYIDTIRDRVPECRKTKSVGKTWMAKCNQFTHLPFKGLNSNVEASYVKEITL